MKNRQMNRDEYRLRVTLSIIRHGPRWLATATFLIVGIYLIAIGDVSTLKELAAAVLKLLE